MNYCVGRSGRGMSRTCAQVLSRWCMTNKGGAFDGMDSIDDGGS